MYIFINVYFNNLTINRDEVSFITKTQFNFVQQKINSVLL